MDGLPNDSRVACEAPAPVFVTDDANGLGVESVIVRDNRPSQRGVHAKNRIIIPGDELAGYRWLRLPIHAHVQPKRAIGEGARENLILIAEAPVVLVGKCGKGLALIGVT